MADPPTAIEGHVQFCASQGLCLLVSADVHSTTWLATDVQIGVQYKQLHIFHNLQARIYDRLEGAERLEAPRRRFAEVDAGAEALRPGAVVALAFDCDELLTARRSSEGGGQWALATAATDWSSRGKRTAQGSQVGPHTAGGSQGWADPGLIQEAAWHTSPACRRIGLAHPCG